VKKELVPVDLRGADFSCRSNKYDTGNPERSVFDERTIEKWSLGGRRVAPYLGFEDTDEEDEIEGTEVLACIEKRDNKYIPKLLRYKFSIEKITDIL
jgi:hypothetical protein